MSVVKATMFAVWISAFLASGAAPSSAKTPITCTGHKQLCEWRAKVMHTSTAASCRQRFDFCMNTGIWKNASGDPFKSFRQ
jgi:hypothetical protein